jgi:hypothetical protein
MITAVMESVGNYFLKYTRSYYRRPIFESLEMVFDAGLKTITLDYAETYKVGQYILIRGTDLNDGVKKINTVAVGVLTVDDNLIDEDLVDTEETACIFPLRVPQDFVSLVARIETWLSSGDSNPGVASEKIDDYSIAYAAAAQTGGFKAAFGGDLTTYNKLNKDRDMLRCYCGY